MAVLVGVRWEAIPAIPSATALQCIYRELVSRLEVAEDTFPERVEFTHVLEAIGVEPSRRPEWELAVGELWGRDTIPRVIWTALTRVGETALTGKPRTVPALPESIGGLSRSEWHQVSVDEKGIHPSADGRVRVWLDEESERKSAVQVSNGVEPFGGYDNLLFHATSHAFALAIAQFGPELRGANTDFACGGAFYLGNCFADAKEWARIKHHRVGGAVLVYSADWASWGKGRDLGLVPTPKWEAIVTECRTGDDEAAARGEWWIAGLQCGNPTHLRRGRSVRVASRECSCGNHKAWQIALRREGPLGRIRLVAIVFFSVSPQ